MGLRAVGGSSILMARLTSCVGGGSGGVGGIGSYPTTAKLYFYMMGTGKSNFGEKERIAR